MSKAQENRADKLKSDRADKLKAAVEKEGWALGVHNPDDFVGFTVIVRDGKEIEDSVPLIADYYRSGRPSLKTLIELCRKAE